MPVDKMKIRAIIKSSKEKMFLNCRGGMFIFSLCGAIFAEQTFCKHRKRVIFLNMKNGGESEIQR